LALRSQQIDVINTLSGTLTFTVYWDTTLPAWVVPLTNVLGVSDFIERIENDVNFMEIPSLRLTLREQYDSFEYPEGLWYEMISESARSGLETPQFKIQLTEGTPKTIFWGIVIPDSVKVREVYQGGAGNNIRTIDFEIASAFTKLREVSFASMITEMLTNRYTEENPLGKVTSRTATKQGIHAGTTTYGYRVAARNATTEFAWSDEFTVTNADPTLTGTEFIRLQFTGITGATDYAIYRTTASGGGVTEVRGFYGLKGSGGGGTITFDDTGGINTAGTTQIKLSARRFIKMTDWARVALQLGFGQAFSNSASNYNHDSIRFKQASTSLTFDTTYMLARYNTGTLGTPVMANIPYLDSAHGDFWNFPSAYEITGFVGKIFGLYPRYYFLDGSIHVIDYLARGRFGNLITLDGSIIESMQSPDSSLNPRSIRCYRIAYPDQTASGGTLVLANEYVYNPFEDSVRNIDLEFGSPFSVRTTAILPEETVNVWEKMYRLVDAGSGDGFTVTATACDGADFYNHLTTSFEAATGEYEYEEAWVKYWKNLTIRRRKSYERTYGSIKATDGASSALNVHVMKRHQINDGFATRNFYANEVRRDFFSNRLEVEWVET
jgi:hypothetical protein